MDAVDLHKVVLFTFSGDWRHDVCFQLVWSMTTLMDAVSLDKVSVNLAILMAGETGKNRMCFSVSFLF